MAIATTPCAVCNALQPEYNYTAVNWRSVKALGTNSCANSGAEGTLLGDKHNNCRSIKPPIVVVIIIYNFGIGRADNMHYTDTSQMIGYGNHIRIKRVGKAN